jgi:exosortase K
VTIMTAGEPGTRPWPRNRAADLGCVACALALAWGLKAFYSRASFEDLSWVLSPTRRLVEWLSGDGFEAEAGQGYLSRERHYLIAPACAGVNFMIVAFVSVVVGLLHTRSTIWGRGMLLVVSALAAYGVGVLANASRIAVAMRLYDAGAAWGPLTAARLHCAAGVTVYLLYLYALFAVAARATGAHHELAT